MAVASLLLTISVYILLPVMPRWLMEEENFTPVEVGRSMGVFGLGLYLFGSCCSWLVQRYRRNVVCMWAIVTVIVNLILLLYIDTLRTTFVDFTIIMVHRFMLGATFGLAQMVLTSTLVIDTCESFQRTEANHSASWFSRFALSLGPLAGLIVSALYGFEGVVWSAVGCAVGALLLVKIVTFPFRTPEEGVKVVSLDRFFLTHGFILFVNLLLVTTVIGLLLSMPFEPLFYALMMGGFLMALLAQRFVFRDAELKSEIITGLFLLLAALAILLVARYHRLTLPAVLHQAESSLSARHLAEHLFPGVGDRYCLGLVSGLCLFLRAAHNADIYGSGHHRCGIGTIPFLYAQLVPET